MTGRPLGSPSPTGPAEGEQRGPHRQISVRVDEELYQEIRAFALEGNTSFAEAYRTLAQWGLDSTKEY